MLSTVVGSCRFDSKRNYTSSDHFVRFHSAVILFRTSTMNVHRPVEAKLWKRNRKHTTTNHRRLRSKLELVTNTSKLVSNDRGWTACPWQSDVEEYLYAEIYVCAMRNCRHSFCSYFLFSDNRSVSYSSAMPIIPLVEYRLTLQWPFL